MKQVLAAEDYVVFGFMLLFSALIGLYFRLTGGRQKTLLEYLMAGKNMMALPVTFSLMATITSGISLLGFPAETYLYGTQYFFWSFALPFGALIIAYGMLPVYFKMQVATAHEYLEKRFGRVTRTFASLLYTFQNLFYMAIVIYAPALALNAVTKFSKWAAILSLGIVCTFYSTLGGLKAVLWTDVLQAFLMYLTVISIVIQGTIHVGGTKEVFKRAREGGRLIFFNTSFDFTERYTLWNTLVSGLMYCFFSFGSNQTQIQRLLSVDQLKKAQRALICSTFLIILFNIFCFWSGIIIYAMFYDCDPLLMGYITSPDQLTPYAIIKLFSHLPGMSGLCITGIFSAALSTMSSGINSLCAVTFEDFIKPYCFCKGLTEKRESILAKFIALCYGALCIIIIIIVENFRGILEAANIILGMVGGPMFGIFILGMMTQTSNEPGILIGLIAGFIMNAWIGFGYYAANIKFPFLEQSIKGCDNSTIRILSSGKNSTFDSSGHVIPVLSQIEKEERYVFPLYKVSFTWFPAFGLIVTLIVGYASSFFIYHYKVQPSKELVVFSPFIRKFIKNIPDKEETSQPKNEESPNSEEISNETYKTKL